MVRVVLRSLPDGIEWRWIFERVDVVQEDRRKLDLLVRSCARMQQVFLGSVVSDGSISGALSFRSLFG
jgi:hypothetical protein